MVRNSFFFLKNVKFSYLNMLFFDDLEKNFVFFKKCNNFVFFDFKFIKIKKINLDKSCINVLYF